MNEELSDKQIKLIKEANALLKKLGTAKIGIVAIDGSFHWFNTNIWKIDGIRLDCSFSGFTNSNSGNKYPFSTYPLTSKIECQH